MTKDNYLIYGGNTHARPFRKSKKPKRLWKQRAKKITVHVPEIDSQFNDHGNDPKIVILVDDNYDGLNIRQAMFLKVVLESWINFRGN
jgi:hypothetical protein